MCASILVNKDDSDSRLFLIVRLLRWVCVIHCWVVCITITSGECEKKDVVGQISCIRFVDNYSWVEVGSEELRKKGDYEAAC